MHANTYFLNFLKFSVVSKMLQKNIYGKNIYILFSCIRLKNIRNFISYFHTKTNTKFVFLEYCPSSYGFNKLAIKAQNAC